MAESRLCSIEGCCKPIRAREWCVTHYHRWLRSGDASKPPQKQSGAHRRVDVTGQTFGKLTAVSALPNTTRQGVAWLCRCQCGNQATVLVKKLRNGHTTSCGCYRNITHGMTHSSEYGSWQAMRSRCESPQNVMYHRYGGRGITVCDRWLTFENFLSDMGKKPSPKHSIDRKDNEGNYTLENCRWATKLEQDNNRSTNRIVTVNGQTGSVAELCRTIQPRPPVSRLTIESRIFKGWDIHDAFYRPYQRGRHYKRIT